MTSKLHVVVSPLLFGKLPRPLAAFPVLSATLSLVFVLPLLVIAGCAESAQDAATDTQEAPAAPALSAAPEMSEAPAAPAMSAAPEMSMTSDATLQIAPSNEPVYLTSEKTARMNLPFSDAVRVGNLLFLSGQIGVTPGTTDLAPGGIQGEARQTMENIKEVLEANGSSMDRVIKATVMLADISEWPAFNEVYVTYFPGHKPARSAFAGSGLAFGARCEVEVIATVGE